MDRLDVAYSVITEGLGELERIRLDEVIATGDWWGGVRTADESSVPVRSLEDELAEWGTSPEAESGLLAFLGDEPVPTAT